MASNTYDVVIIGGGTAGLVLANRLSENKSLHVLVIESGQDRTADPSTLTPGAWPLLANSSASWAFKTTQQDQIGRKTITVPQGRAVGGSSAINSFLFVPTSKLDLDTWEKLGNKGWSYEAFDSALRKAFTLHKVSGAKEGDGPLQVRIPEPATPLQQAWVDGLKAIGFPRSDPFSGHICGAVIAPESIDPATRQRSYASNAYLYPVHGRQNLTVLTETTVTKILVDKSPADSDAVAKGVQYTDKDGTSQTVNARKEVIISAGTINSPRLLELSGIGGANILQGLGVDIVVDNPHVGENLENHVFTGMSFEVHDHVETIDAFFRQEPEAVAAAMEEYATKGTGPMSTSNMITTAHLPLPEFQTEEGHQDLQQLLSTLDSKDDAQGFSPSTKAFASAHADYVRSILTDTQQPLGHYVMGPAYVPFDDSPTYRAPGKWISVAIELAHPLSRGSVHITSASPEQAGSNEGVSVDPKYLSHPRKYHLCVPMV
jgi:choline dehydrogenase-like flavoprotein